MGREEHRGALANAQFVDVVPDVHASLGIEPDRRLVEEQDPRRVEQTPSDLEAPLHATGVEAGLLTRPVGEPDHLEQRVHAPLDLRTVQPVQDGVEAQVLLTCEVVVQGHFLKDEPDVRTDLVTGAQDVVTGDPGEPVGGVEQRAQHRDRGGLAGAVGSEEAEQLTRFDRERDAIDGGEVTEPLDEAVDLDGPVRPVRRDHDGSGYRQPDGLLSIEPVHEQARPAGARVQTYVWVEHFARAREPSVGSSARRRAPGRTRVEVRGRWPRLVARSPPTSALAAATLEPTSERPTDAPYLSIARTNAYIIRSGHRRWERPRPHGGGFLPAKPICRVIGTFDPAPDASDVSSSPFVRHYAPTGSQISALSRVGAWRKPGHRRLLQRDVQHGEVEKSLLGGELVAHSLNSSGQDRGDFG